MGLVFLFCCWVFFCGFCCCCFFGFFFKEYSRETQSLNILVALEYLCTSYRTDQRESLQGNCSTEEQKVEFKQDTLQNLKENLILMSKYINLPLHTDFGRFSVSAASSTLSADNFHIHKLKKIGQHFSNSCPISCISVL